LVNKLIDNGIITEEEAKNHPQRNVITRAIQGNSIKLSKADIHVISDTQHGDYFFLCSDGILEGINSGDLVRILSSKNTDKNKINEIKKRCEIRSKDNFTAILVPI